MNEKFGQLNIMNWVDQTVARSNELGGGSGAMSKHYELG